MGSGGFEVEISVSQGTIELVVLTGNGCGDVNQKFVLMDHNGLQASKGNGVQYPSS